MLEVRGSFDEALASCLELADRGTFVLVNSLNPDRIEGQKTAAFEIVEELGRAPDVLALPYGGGGNTVAYAKGFAEEGAATQHRLGAGRRARGHASPPRSASPSRPTLAEVDGARRRRAASRSSPSATTRSRDAWLELASREGIFCEPSSAAGLAGLAHAELEPGSTVVCVLTGHGLKDTAAVDVLTEATTVVEPSRRRDPRGGCAGERHASSFARRRRRRTSAPASTAPPPRSTSGTSSR